MSPDNCPALANVKVLAEAISIITPCFSTPSDWITVTLSPIFKLFFAIVSIEYVKLDESIIDTLLTSYLGLTFVNHLVSNAFDALMPSDLISILSFLEKYEVLS